MVGEVFAGLAGFKTMLDIAKGLKDIDSAVTRNNVAIDLTDRILTAQRETSALLEQIDALKAQIVQLEAWEAAKQRYDLQPVAAGVFAYVLKPGVQPPETPHNACPNCYSDKRISVLQQEMRANRRTFLVCHHCDLALNLSGGHEPFEPTVERGGTWAKSRRRGGF